MRNGFSTVLRKYQTFLALIIITFTSLLIYANTFNSAFVYDDKDNILENPFIRLQDIRSESLTNVFKSRSTYRPLANFSFAVNYFFHGYDVRGYHLINLTIHIITALLVFLVARQTMQLCETKNPLIPFFSAVLWLVNPVHTQSVTYIVQRMNAMAAMFFMVALFFYIKARMMGAGSKGRIYRYILFCLCLLSFISGLASKQIVVTLPIVLFFYEWFFFQKLSRRWLKKQIYWMLLAALVVFLLALFYMDGNPWDLLLGQYEKRGFTLAQRLLTQPRVVVYYLSLLIFPHPTRITLLYDFSLSDGFFHPPVTSLALLAIATLLIAAIYRPDRKPLCAFVFMWFLITMVIESSVVGLDIIYAHRTYLPSIFPFIGFVFLVFHHVRPQRLAILLLSLTIGVCGFWTYQRNSAWQNALTMWSDNRDKSPEKAECYNSLGCAYKDLKVYDKAIEAYEKSLEIVFERGGVAQFALYNLGTIALQLEQFQNAVIYFQKAVTCDPNFAEAHLKLATALLKTGHTDAAIESCSRAVEINPGLEMVYNNLGIAWFRKGDMTKAVKAFKQALTINPYFPEASANLKKISRINRKYGLFLEGVISHARQRPGDSQAAYKAGQISQLAGMTDQAIAWYEQALSVDPRQPVYLVALGGCYAEAGRIADAIEIYKRLSLETPGNPTVYYNLACLFARQNDKGNAVVALREAINSGYSNLEHLKTDEDLKNIKDTDYFQSLIK